MTADQNPYAPPRSETDFGRVDADPESYWIEDELLHVRHGAVLPDVCLGTGTVEGVLVREKQAIQHRPTWTLSFFIFLCFVLPRFATTRSSPVILVVLLTYFLFMIFRQKVSIDYCLSKEFQSRRQKAINIHLGVTLISIVGMLILHDLYDLSFLWMLAPVLISGLTIRRWVRSFIPVGLKQKTARLKHIHPEALRQLDRWRSAKLPKETIEI